jgi:hypothetical protein
VLLGVGMAWAGLLLAIALFVPYHGTDALVYGSWSERIADLGTLRTPGATNALLHRPLFYGVQGALWDVFGVHEWIGRLWSWLFFALLIGATVRLAAGRTRDWLTAGVAVALLLAVPDLAVQAAAGQTDVPVAALVAAAAAIAWTVAPSPWRALGLTVVVLAVSLTKPSAFPAIAGLALATMIGPRADWRRRLLNDTLPIVAGVALALVYHVIQARYLHQSLYDFLAGATEDPRAVTAVNAQVGNSYAEARRTVVVAAQWLGPYVAVLMLYALVYAPTRVVRIAHRRAALIALPIAAVGAWLLPFIAQSDAHSVRVGPLEAGQPGTTVAFLLLLIPLWLFARVPADQAPSRLFCGRMLLWTAPVVVAWIYLNPSETRYLSASWVPLVLLMAPVLAGAWRAATSRGPLAASAVLLVPLALVGLNLRNIDSLGTRPDGTYSAWRALGDLQLSDLGHPERMRAVADPQLAGMVSGGRRVVRGKRLLTNDGRMIFFFPRVTVRAPGSCVNLRRYDGVALLDNLAVAPLDLTTCQGVRIVAGVPGSYVIGAIR